MSTKPFLIGTLFVLLAAACSEDQFDLYGKEDLLINSWVDPQRNCEGNTLFLKPAGSGGIAPGERNQLDLYADGRAKYVVLSKRDPHRYDFVTNVTGSWIFNPEARTLAILNSSGKVKFTFQVLSLSRDELVINYIENSCFNLPR